MKLYKQLLMLVFLSCLLLGIITGIVYVLMEGPTNIISRFSSKDEDKAISENNTITEQVAKPSLKHEAPKGSRERKGNIDYIKINTYELYELCESKEDYLKGNSYLMRGIVYKPEHLTEMGEFGLMRIAMWCCAADATAYGFRIPYDNMESLKNGEWVKVYGRPVKKSAVIKDNWDVKSKLAPHDEIHKGWLFEADYIEPTDTPEDPFITYWSSKEPFKY